MLTYTLGADGEKAMFEELYELMRDDITSGRVPAGARMPSKRALARNIGVSMTTVESAYAQLVAEGYVRSIRRKGYFAASVKEAAQLAPPPRRALSSEDDARPAIDLTGRTIDPSLFPFSVWASLARRVMRERRAELMKNSPGIGVSELRRAIASHMRAFRGIDAEPERIVVGAGTEYLYGLIVQLLGRDLRYGVEDPGHRKIAQVYASHGARVVRLPVDEEGLMPVACSEADVVHISPSHHFPTGVVMPIGRRYELLGWASRSDERYIIEDDYDSEFRLTGRPIPALQSVDASGRVIYMNTFSKTLSSTVRISYMVLPPHLMDSFSDKLGYCSCTVSNFEQYTLAALIDEGHFERHIGRARAMYIRKRDELLRAIKRGPLRDRASVLGQEAGIHFLMRLATDIPDAVLVQRLREHDLDAAPLSSFYEKAPPEAEHTFVVNYSSLAEGMAERAVASIAECLTS